MGGWSKILICRCSTPWNSSLRGLLSWAVARKCCDACGIRASICLVGRLAERMPGQPCGKRPQRRSSMKSCTILHNPAYAGAFVYGRRAAPAERSIEQRDRRQRQAVDQWNTIHYQVYPAYISWETFMANQARLADNAKH